MNTDLLTLALSEISCCQNRECCTIVFGNSVFRNNSSFPLATGLLLHCHSAHVSFSKHYYCHNAAVWSLSYSELCVAPTALFYSGKSVVLCLWGCLIRQGDMNETWCLSYCIIPVIPSALLERRRRMWMVRQSRESDPHTETSLSGIFLHPDSLWCFLSDTMSVFLCLRFIYQRSRIHLSSTLQISNWKQLKL